MKKFYCYLTLAIICIGYGLASWLESFSVEDYAEYGKDYNFNFDYIILVVIGIIFGLIAYFTYQENKKVSETNNKEINE